jgi:hypothetical protein
MLDHKTARKNVAGSMELFRGISEELKLLKFLTKIAPRNQSLVLMTLFVIFKFRAQSESPVIISDNYRKE